MFTGTETLSLSVNEPIAKQILHGGNRPPIWGGGRARGSGVAPRESPRIRQNLFAGTETPSLSVNESIAKQILHGGNHPPIWVGVRARGSGVAPGESPP